MKFLKSLFSFTIPLIIVLTILSLYLSIGQVLNNYKYKINNDYSIMIVTSTPIIKENIKVLANMYVRNIEVLHREDIVNNLKSKLSSTSLELLEKKLPYFYNIHLQSYPTTSQLAKIKIELSTIANVKRIETFSSNHNQIYSLLILIDNIVSVLFVLFMISSILLLSKQVKIWFFEHSTRISIIEYHGGSIWYSAKPMIRLAILSSLIASGLVIVVSMYISNNLSQFVSNEILLVMSNTTLTVDSITIVATAFAISMVSLIGLVFKHKMK